MLHKSTKINQLTGYSGCCPSGGISSVQGLAASLPPLELASGADFWCNLHCFSSRGRSRGSRGPPWAPGSRKSNENPGPNLSCHPQLTSPLLRGRPLAADARVSKCFFRVYHVEPCVTSVQLCRALGNLVVRNCPPPPSALISRFWAQAWPLVAARSYYTVLYYTILYYTILYYIIKLYYTILNYIIL